MGESTKYLRNTNEHRIYYDDAKSFVRAGGVFEGTAADAKRPNVVELSQDEYDAQIAAERGEEVANDGSYAAARGVHELSAAAAMAGTAGERGDLPHTREALAQESSEAISAARTPGTALLGELGKVADSKNIPALISPVQPQDDGDDGLQDLVKSELQDLADEHDVEYLKGDTNDELVAKLRAANVRAPEPGE